MSYPQKEGKFVVVLTLVVLFFSVLFLIIGNDSGGNLTGAAVSNVEKVVAVPSAGNEEAEEVIVDAVGTTVVDSTDSSSSDLLNGLNKISSYLNVQLDSANGGNFLSVQSDPTTRGANSTQCGRVNNSITLTANVNSSSTCFHVNVSNVVIDCKGFTVNYSYGGTAGYGVNNSGFTNVTVQNCRFLEGTSTTNTKYGIYFLKDNAQTSVPLRGTVYNNTFLMVGAFSDAIVLDDANSTNISSNIINASASRSDGIVISRSANVSLMYNSVKIFGPDTNGLMLGTSPNSVVYANNFTSYGASASTIEVKAASGLSLSNNNVSNLGDGYYTLYFNNAFTSENVTVYSNDFFSNGSNSRVFYLSRVNSSLFSENRISAIGNLSHGIYFETSANNLFLNNYIAINHSVAATYEIYDDNIENGVNFVNFLIYNNSYGEIKWIDNGTGGFLRNMDVAGALGLDTNIYISNNTILFNSSAISFGLLNYTPANITFFNLSFANITQLFKVANGSYVDASFIYTHGSNCLGSTCSLKRFGLKRVTFNVTSFSSYAVNGTDPTTNNLPNVTQIFVNASTFENRTDDTLYCWVRGGDASQDLLLAYWSWYRNSVLYSSGSTEILNNTLTAIATVPANDTSITDFWNCSVRLFDGLDNETTFHNATLQISPYLCGDSITSNATLTANVLGCSGTGLNVSGDDVVLNCNQKLISGTGSMGLYVNDKDRVTIKNCNVSGFTDSIVVKNSLNSVIMNNTINSSGRVGLFVEGANHSLILGNTIKDTVAAGIFLNGTDSSGSSITNFNNSILNNTILRNNGTWPTGSGEVDIGGIAFASYYNKFNFVSGNNISNNKYRAIYLGLYATNTSFRDNVIQNSTFGYMFSGAYTNITGDKLYDLGSALAGYGSLESTILVKDALFVGNTYDLNLSSGVGISSNFTFLNTSLNKNKLKVPSGSYAYFKSYVTLNASLVSGLPADGVAITGYNSLEEVEDTGTTAINGILRLNVMEFYRTNNINYFVTPSTIKVTNVNYSQNSTTIDLYNVTEAYVNITTRLFSCSSAIGSNFNFGNNFNCQLFGLNITNGNVTIDGSYYNLTGNGSGIGIEFYEIQINKVKRLQLQNFSRAISFRYTNNTNLTGLRIVNNTIGIYFDHAHNNYVYDTILGNNTNVSVFAVNDGETNNSLVNVSLYNLENITVVGGATIYRKWYVDVNVTFNGGNPLAGANISAYFNNTQIWETSRVTDGNGRVRLEVSELFKNSSEVFYLTPNSINLTFNNQGTLFKNATIINLTKTNNTLVHLSLALNCTAPSTNLLLTSSTTFCPGTFSVENVTIGSHNVTLTCVGTTLLAPSSYKTGIAINGFNNTKIQNCQFQNYYYGMNLISIVNFTSIGNTFTGSDTGIRCVGAKNSLFTQDSYDSSSSGTDLYFISCNNSIVSFNTFQGDFNMIVASSLHNIIRNNTFKEGGTGLTFAQDGIFGSNLYPTNNTFYYNNFTGLTGYYVDIRESGYSGNLFNITANGSINFSAQGNVWSDYCNKGRDLNSDGYADTNKIGSADYPYNDTVSTKFLVASGEIVDYGPRMFDCPAENVFLSTSGTSTSGASSAGGGGVATAPSAPGTAAGLNAAASEGGSGGGAFYSAAEAKQFLVISKQGEVQSAEGFLEVYITLENTGDKSMNLLPLLQQDIDDPYFMLTRRTLGAGEGSMLEVISKLSYSKNPIAGTLLKAILVNQEEIIIPPGGKVEKALQVKEGFGSTKPMKIQFSSLGETILEKDIPVGKKSMSAAAVDTHENYLDIYAILVPEGAEKKEGVIVGSELTGAAIFDKGNFLADANSPYFLELSLNKKNKEGKMHTVFSDQYGPYPLKQKESFLFAQQLKYDPLVYNGNYVVQSKMYHGPALVVQNEFDVTLGEEGKETTNGFWLWVVLLGVIVIIMGQGLHFMKVYYNN